MKLNPGLAIMKAFEKFKSKLSTVFHVYLASTVEGFLEFQTLDIDILEWHHCLWLRFEYFKYFS